MKTLAATLLLATSVVASAQPTPPQGQPLGAQPAPGADDQGLTGEVTAEGAWQDLGIAIPAFATDANRPTPANAQGTGALGVELGRVVYNDLKNNGLFKPTGPDALPHPDYINIASPLWAVWQGRNTEMLVEGYVRGGGDGQLV